MELNDSVLQVESKPRSFNYAGFWIRFFAVLIDGLILGLVQILMRPLFGLPMIDFENNPETALSTASLTATLVSFVGSWLYYALMESSTKRATLGKMVVGIHITDVNGNRISFTTATGRYFAKILSAITLMIGYIMAAFTAKKQALHDKLAGTVVLYDVDA